jgi:RHS repeat-associated protein
LLCRRARTEIRTLITIRSKPAEPHAGGFLITLQGYVWNDNTLLMDGENAYIYAAGDVPAEQVSLANGTVTYLVSDALESVRGTVNSSGTLTGSTSYDAWGNPLTNAGLTGTTPFGYAGAYTDPDGLLYLINRYYDPATGQFTSVDPDLEQTLQPYAYTDGDPVIQSDPTGNQVVYCNLVVEDLSLYAIMFRWNVHQTCYGNFGSQNIGGQELRSSWSGWRGYGSITYAKVTRSSYISHNFYRRCNRGHGWYNYDAGGQGFASALGWSPIFGDVHPINHKNCGPWPPAGSPGA